MDKETQKWLAMISISIAAIVILILILSGYELGGFEIHRGIQINKIPITSINIASIYAPNKKDNAEDIFKGKEGESEKLKAVSSALRKLSVASLVREKDGEYELNAPYSDSETVMQGHIPNQFFRTTRDG